jgi:hypothetical protein
MNDGAGLCPMPTIGRPLACSRRILRALTYRPEAGEIVGTGHNPAPSALLTLPYIRAGWLPI